MMFAIWADVYQCLPENDKHFFPTTTRKFDQLRPMFASLPEYGYPGNPAKMANICPNTPKKPITTRKKAFVTEGKHFWPVSRKSR